MDKPSITKSSLNETQTTVKSYKPADSDYVLTGIRLEPAKNGVIVNCDYTMSDEARSKACKSGCYDTYREPEKTIFEDYDGVIAYVTKELGKLKGQKLPTRKY